jgi:hypothetical protein
MLVVALGRLRSGGTWADVELGGILDEVGDKSTVQRRKSEDSPHPAAWPVPQSESYLDRPSKSTSTVVRRICHRRPGKLLLTASLTSTARYSTRRVSVRRPPTGTYHLTLGPLINLTDP